MNAALTVLALQGLIGAIDNLWHHAMTERLHARRGARRELALHAARELLYAGVFLVLAWWEPRGLAAVALAATLTGEIVITVLDFLEEDATRRLPRFERVLHTVLALNYGAFLALFAPTLWLWAHAPTALAATDHGLLSWVLAVFGFGVGLWGLADAAFAARLYRPPHWQSAPMRRARPASGRVVAVTGATGFVGRHLVRALLARGDEVVAVSRDPAHAADLLGPLVRAVPSVDALGPDEPVDAIVHLAGAPLLERPWTATRRRTLVTSRVSGARAIARHVRHARHAPTTVLVASAIGWYGARDDDTTLSEHSAPGTGFQTELCRAVEEAADDIARHGVRVVSMRIGLVLGREGGAFPALARPLRLGLRMMIGARRAWLSWVHVDDLVRAALHLLDDTHVQGPVNVTAPGSVTQARFHGELAQQLGTTVRWSVPAWPLRAAFGEMAELLLDGQRVAPTRLCERGFRFTYPDLDAALAALLSPPAPGPDTGLEVFYNGACPVCAAEVRQYRARARAGVQFTDINRRPCALSDYGVGFAELERRVYVRAADGTVVSGIPALIALWARVRGGGAVARAAAWAPLGAVAFALYDLVVSPAVVAWSRWRRRTGRWSTPL